MAPEKKLPKNMALKKSPIPSPRDRESKMLMAQDAKAGIKIPDPNPINEPDTITKE